MTDTWARLRVLFEAAIELPANEREAFLSAECGGDESMRRAVESLIAADRAAGRFLDEPVVAAPRAEPSSPTSPWAVAPGSTLVQDDDSAAGRIDAPVREPTVIGPYRISRRLGQGGMGMVYLAVRDDGFQRRVVIKVVRQDLDDPDLLRRLRAERQILASLDHPHIAKLYDGGATDDQRPYFVMEYIEGVPIDKYCDDHRLTVDERLSLFRKVCAAVQYAHQNLVVHRDLKPSNILVAADGEPKLLDFGIAKLLNPELASPELDVTATWLRLMTPQYASPEQVRGKLVTTASDVYSLGVLLFKLLTGRYPFRFASRSPREIERILTDQEPPKPSTVVLADPVEDDAAAGAGESSAESSAGEPSKAVANIARARAVRPQDLGRRLAGDLDSIVLKALRSAPQRRYASAEGLAADLERFQLGLPVTARRGTWRYRASRFLARHRLPVIASAIVLALLVAFAFTSYRQSQQVMWERDQALHEQQRKETVMALLLDVLQVADPYSDQGQTLTVREALEASRLPLQRRLKDEPALRAELLHTTGVVFSNLGLWQSARDDLEQAATLRRGLHGERHLDVAATDAVLAYVLAELGEDRAIELAEQAYETVEGDPGASQAQQLDATNQLVGVYCIAGEYRAAAPFAEKALDLARQVEERDLDALSTALYNQASVYLAAGDNARAAVLYRQVVALEEQLHGAEYLSLATAWNNLGAALRRAGDEVGAEDAFRHTLTIQRKNLGDGHHYLAGPLNNVAGILSRRGDFEAASELWQEARQIMKEQVGQHHARVLFLDLQIAGTRIARGQADAIERQLRTMKVDWGSRLGTDHRFVQMIDRVHADALIALGRDQDAELLLESYIEAIRERGRRQDLLDVIEVLTGVYQRLGRPNDIDHYRQWLDAKATG